MPFCKSDFSLSLRHMLPRRAAALQPKEQYDVKHQKEAELEAMMNEGGGGNASDERKTRTEPSPTATTNNHKEAEAVKQAECCTIC